MVIFFSFRLINKHQNLPWNFLRHLSKMHHYFYQEFIILYTKMWQYWYTFVQKQAVHFVYKLKKVHQYDSLFLFFISHCST
jgi:hypothetical protein